MRTGVAGLIVAAVLCGCGESETNGPQTVTVQPGQSIQAAVDTAPPNAVILVQPGVYHESPASSRAVTITTDGIQIVGQSTPEQPVVLESVGGQKAGIWVSPADSVATYDDTEGVINQPLTVKDIRAVIFFKQTQGNHYRVSLRSKGDVDIGAVAKEYGGGGHRNAAGCSVDGPIDELRNILVDKVTHAIDGRPARH